MMTKKRIAFLTLSVTLMAMLLAGAVFGQAAGRRDDVYRYLSIFSEVFDLVRSNYVEPVTSDQLMEGAFAGVTDAVDEFSYYIPPAQMAAYRSFTDVDDNNVGLVLSRRFGYAYVISSVPGSPADKAGIKRGDFIEKIDGQPLQKLAIWQVRNALRTGKPLQLQVLRGGETTRDQVTLQPATYHPLALQSQTLSGVAYIKVPYFEKGTAEQFRSALAEAHNRGEKKLIVDLRGNAGGSFDEAIAAADDLLTSGLITALEGRKIEKKQWQADRATAYDGDVEVLTDISTAGGAEVFASAIRGNGRGKVVGVPTYGKAIMQRMVSLPSGGGVYMTVAHYTTPEQKPIAEGVKPDVTVDLTVQAIDAATSKGHPVVEEDLILEKALELFGAPIPASLKKAA